jgi:hypothetical protein
MFASPVLPVLTGLVTKILAALLAIAPRILPLALAVCAVLLSLSLPVSHVHAIAIGHPVLQICRPFLTRRREVLSPISISQASSNCAAEARQRGRPLTGTDPRTLTGADARATPGAVAPCDSTGRQLTDPGPPSSRTNLWTLANANARSRAGLKARTPTGDTAPRAPATTRPGRRPTAAGKPAAGRTAAESTTPTPATASSHPAASAAAPASTTAPATPESIVHRQPTADDQDQRQSEEAFHRNVPSRICAEVRSTVEWYRFNG